MGSVRGVGLALGAILVSASLYGYNEYASLYNEKLNMVRSSCRYPLYKAVWSEYEENMNKLDRLFPVSWRYMSYNEFFEFATSLRTDRPVRLYYDSDAMMIWMQDTFPGSLIRVSIYGHKDVGGFMDWVYNWVDSL